MLYFHSPNEFPIEVLYIMGLSAKVTDRPIGRFGTGLKYAIAGVLRIGGSVTLQAGGRTYTFSAESASLRGQNYHSIFMTGPEGRTLLPFTLTYGQDWAPWQLYREFYSNCLDESGDVSPVPVEAETVFIVKGLDGVEHKEIFLPKDKPLYALDTAEIYDRPTHYTFFRGIRVRDLDRSQRYTINLLNHANLTEDRLLAYDSTARWHLTYEVLQSTDEELIKFFCTTKDVEDYLMLESHHRAGETFLQVAGELRSELLTDVEIFYNRIIGSKRSITPCEMSAFEKGMLEDAFRIIRPLIRSTDLSRVFVVESITRAWGLYKSNTSEIFISRANFDEGVQHLAATLYEEFLHYEQGIEDETRKMQEYLLKRVIRQQMQLQACR
jgi:hypothetical protein